MNSLYSTDLYERSNNDIIVDLGRRFKDYRIALRLTQKDVAKQSGVSIMTIVRFEKGEAYSIRLDNLVALLRAIQRLENISEIIPEVPRSLYDTRDELTNKRVRRKKNEK
ncbi:MAG: helix-turn-helix domain-containing protein [Bacteroidales bacterium]|nr:helix-turn-helix domain-containing protein [Bacteroidales bacterium]